MNNVSIAAYAQFMTAHGYLAPSSCAAYVSDIHLFVSWAYDFRRGLRWSTATRTDFEDFVAHLVFKEYEYSSINRILSALTSLYSYFVHEGALTRNVLYDVRRLRPSYHQRQSLTGDIVTRVLSQDSLEPGTRALISLLYESGMRIGEAMALNVSDIDFDSLSCRVTGKGRADRRVYFGKTTALALRSYLEGAAIDGRVFPLSRRQYNWDVYHAFAPFAGGRKCSPHILRHTFATESMAAGMPMDVLQLTLGHKNLSTTMLYNHCASSRVASVNASTAPRIS